MTLQQLRYIIAVAHTGSIHTGAQQLFITQPTLSKSIMDLEKEMGITIFYRSNRGVALTDEGTKFLSYAKQVIEQADLLENQYKNDRSVKRIFSVASQHYAFVVNAFVDLVKLIDKDEYEFSLRELRTYEIIEDIRTRRSEIGILYLSHFNEDILKRTFESNGLRWEYLFSAKPHVFLSTHHPLALRSSLTLQDLKNYPRFTYDQGLNNSFYYAEELHAIEYAKKSIVVTDRATLFNLLVGLNGYTISSGIISKELNDDNITAVPLKSNEKMDMVYIYRADNPLSDIAKTYVDILTSSVKNYQPAPFDNTLGNNK
ncbi:LysR family transcriptional regulator [Peptoniphilus equinus]|uniref:LysR family transcriptional regulator n=1 Tax=Peptoniphilus equinus TaxID=3016343 RepID=A0ABY7QUW9_9FIRM|nr:LysR family transcriptional regulator [Peptoniphilus equinus]WBW49693.1 LysR family transcriptional regulator [Peptoniphilus equinus]